jgi:hypothetical protein
MTPETIVQLQLDAYNARDLQRFVACYSDPIQMFRPPAAEPVLDGKTAFADYYATQRFNRPGLHAQLVNRRVLGRRVIDHERISGIGDAPFEVAVVYEVVEGLIETVWAFAAV